MKKLKFDYSKLKGRIIEKYGTQKAFADLLGINQSTLTLRLLGYTYFTQEEIYRSIDLLSIPENEVTLYFFTA